MSFSKAEHMKFKLDFVILPSYILASKFHFKNKIMVTVVGSIVVL